MERIDYLISRFLTSQITVEEKVELWEWKNENEYNRRIFQELISFWESNPVSDDFEHNQVWEKFLVKKSLADLQDLKTPNSPDLRSNNRFQVPSFLKYAAVFFFALLASITIYQFTENKQQISENTEEVKVIEKSAGKGKKLQLTLPDGSTVKLNSFSKIKFAETFSNGKREIHLTGEAYFDVKPDQKFPFVIHTKSAKITVLGTSFNIKANPEKTATQIAVAHGKVKVENNVSKDDSLILSTNEMAEIINDKSGIAKIPFDSGEVFGWKNGAIIFRNAQWKEIEETLENWYGVNIHTKKEIKMLEGYNAEFSNESLKNVMESLSYALDFDYQLDTKDSQVIIF